MKLLSRRHLVFGSLSVLAGLKGIPYVNVEAQQGHLREQRKMLGALFTLIGRGNYRPPGSSG